VRTPEEQQLGRPAVDAVSGALGTGVGGQDRVEVRASEAEGADAGMTLLGDPGTGLARKRNGLVVAS
jgi:hypothetical protein